MRRWQYFAHVPNVGTDGQCDDARILSLLIFILGCCFLKLTSWHEMNEKKNCAPKKKRMRRKKNSSTNKKKNLPILEKMRIPVQVSYKMTEAGLWCCCCFCFIVTIGLSIAFPIAYLNKNNWWWMIINLYSPDRLSCKKKKGCGHALSKLSSHTTIS